MQSKKANLFLSSKFVKVPGASQSTLGRPAMSACRRFLRASSETVTFIISVKTAINFI